MKKFKSVDDIINYFKDYGFIEFNSTSEIKHGQEGFVVGLNPNGIIEIDKASFVKGYNYWLGRRIGKHTKVVCYLLIPDIDYVVNFDF